MKTIKQLEKKIENIVKKDMDKILKKMSKKGFDFSKECLKLSKIYDMPDGFWSGVELQILRTKLQALKEVLKEIDNMGSFIIEGKSNEDFIKGMGYLAKKLKAELVGK